MIVKGVGEGFDIPKSFMDKVMKKTVETFKKTEKLKKIIGKEVYVKELDYIDLTGGFLQQEPGYIRKIYKDIEGEIIKQKLKYIRKNKKYIKNKFNKKDKEFENNILENNNYNIYNNEDKKDIDNIIRFIEDTYLEEQGVDLDIYNMTTLNRHWLFS